MKNISLYLPYLSGLGMILFGVLGGALHQMPLDQAFVAIAAGVSALGIHHNQVK